MYKILAKRELNSATCLMVIHAPNVARKAEPGQFIILRVDENGERIPLTIADFDREQGSVTIIFQIVGATTELLRAKNQGEYIQDFTGPLGVPAEITEKDNVVLVGGGLGCAIIYPIAKKLHARGANFTVIAGFKNKDAVILEKEFKQLSGDFTIVTDDGSCGEKGFVTDALKKMLVAGSRFECCEAIGPMPMMKFLSKLTKEYNLPTIVSMNTIMVDGTGMCGCCRLTVGGETKFACVDGPDFDGWQVDFDEAIDRATMYKDFEKEARNHVCNLLKKEVL